MTSSQTSILKWLQRPKAVDQPPSTKNTSATSPKTTKPPSCPQTRPEAASGLPYLSPSSPSAEATQIEQLPADDAELIGKLFPQRPLPKSISIGPISAPFLPQFRTLNAVLLPVSYSPSFYAAVSADPLVASVSCAAIDTSTQISTPPYSDELVAAASCALIPILPERPYERVLLVSTLGTYAVHRGHGIATRLIEHAVREGELFLRHQQQQRAWDRAEKESILQRLKLSSKQSGSPSAAGTVVGFGHRHRLPSFYLEDVEKRCREETQTPKLLIRTVVVQVWVANEEAQSFYERLGFKQVAKLENYYSRVDPPHGFLYEKTLP